MAVLNKTLTKSLALQEIVVILGQFEIFKIELTFRVFSANQYESFAEASVDFVAKILIFIDS